MASMEAEPLDQLLAPLIADPARSAIMLDIDGTLSPMVMRTDLATVPPETRETLAKVAAKYGSVACVTGRQCKRARDMVGLNDITYFGNHGSELMRPGSDVVEIVPEAAEWESRVQEFSRHAFERFDLPSLGIRSEDKGVISGMHWRGTPDEDAAETVMHQVAFAAQADGLAVHWAKKILEIRPPLEFSKGTAVSQLLDEQRPAAALFAGDDFTDIHAFEALEEELAAGRIQHAVKIGVDADETPDELGAAADVMVPGIEGVREMLERLAAA